MTLKDQPTLKIVLRNGIVLNYRREGSGTPLIFIHGAMGDLNSWKPQWPHFTASFDCITYSRRYSSPNPNRLETRQHSALVDAEDLLGLMDALSLQRAILVGSSYGGFTALGFAILAPERVKALVSVEAPMMRYAERSEDGASIARKFRANTILPARAAFERGDDLEGVRLLTGGIIGKRATGLSADVLESRMQNAQAARSLALSDDEFPLLEPEALASLSMPILLMSGADTAPVHAAIFNEVLKVMPQAQVCIVRDSGHAVSQQQPAVFNAEVTTFLAQHEL